MSIQSHCRVERVKDWCNSQHHSSMNGNAKYSAQGRVEVDTEETLVVVEWMNPHAVCAIILLCLVFASYTLTYICFFFCPHSSYSFTFVVPFFPTDGMRATAATTRDINNRRMWVVSSFKRSQVEFFFLFFRSIFFKKNLVKCNKQRRR